MPDGPGRPSAPRWPQASPKMAQDGPRTASRRFRVGPRWPDEDHKTAGFTGPLRPRDAQDRSKKHHDVLGCAKPAPDGPRRLLKANPLVKHTTTYSNIIHWVWGDLGTSEASCAAQGMPETSPRQAQNSTRLRKTSTRRPLERRTVSY